MRGLGPRALSGESVAGWGRSPRQNTAHLVEQVSGSASSYPLNLSAFSGLVTNGDYILVATVAVTGSVSSVTCSAVANFVALRTAANPYIYGGYITDPSASMAVSIAGSGVVMHSWAGAFRGSVGIDNAVTYGTFASSSTPSTPAWTVIGRDALGVIVMTSSDDNTPVVNSGQGWTLQYWSHPNGNNSFAVATKPNLVAGSTGTVAWTETTNGPDAGSFTTLALRSAIPII